MEIETAASIAVCSEILCKAAAVMYRSHFTGIANSEIRNLKDQIRILESKLNIKAELVFTDPYYLRYTVDGRFYGPFCVPCFHNKDDLIPLFKYTTSRWHCAVCGLFFGNQAESESPPVRGWMSY